MQREGAKTSHLSGWIRHPLWHAKKLLFSIFGTPAMLCIALGARNHRAKPRTLVRGGTKVSIMFTLLGLYGRFLVYYLVSYLMDNLLKKGKDKVERTKPAVGTIELTNGFGN
jgi:hypothetical protein